MIDVVRHEPSGALRLGGGVFDLRAHFEEIVKANCAAFMHDTGSKQHAFNAVVSLFHFHEKIWHYESRVSSQFGTIEKFKEYIGNSCAEFSTIEALCVCLKHAKPSRKNIVQISQNIQTAMKREVRLLSGNVELPGGGISFDFSKPYAAREEIIAIISGEHAIYYKDLVPQVCDFWETFLLSLEGGVLHANVPRVGPES